MPPRQVGVIPLPGAGFDGTRGAIWHRLEAAMPDLGAALQETGLDTLTVQALTAQETRPRCTPHGQGALLILRGVNTEPGADPEDMVSVRLWVESSRIVTFQFRHLDAINDLVAALAQGDGPGTPGDFVVALADALSDRMQEVIEHVDAALDGLEDTQSA